jgi:hypothetical protein
VAEEFAVEQVVGQAAAVEGHEGAVLAGRELVQALGDELLAGAGLAAHQHVHRVAATSLTSWRTRAICGERPMSLLSMPSRWARRRRRSSTSRVRARLSRARRTTSTSRSGAKGFWMKS